jgi:hypothetical protein
VSPRASLVIAAAAVAVIALLVVGVPVVLKPDPGASVAASTSSSASPSRSPSPSSTAAVSPATPSASVAATASAAPGYVSVDGMPISVLRNEAADVLFGEVQTCVSVAGYTVRFPAHWYTNTPRGHTPACSWFAPEPFDASIRPVAVDPAPPRGVWISMRVVDGAVGYTGVTPIYLSESVELGGYEGHRAEFGPGTLDDVERRPDYRAYQYVIPFEEFGATLLAGTDVDRADDYVLAKAVLDRMMASIRFRG